MACISGTNVVNDGLVFHFDLENGMKSWKGKPTSNLIETNLTNFIKDNDATVIATGEYYLGNPIYRVSFPSGTLPRIRTNFNYISTQQYFGSIYYRVVSQGSHIPQLYFRENNFGLSYVSIPLNSTEWDRAKISYTFSSSGTAMFLLYQSNSSATTPTVIDMAMPQVEIGDIATKFTSGIRLDTASIIDISPSKSTITAANLTYRQDDSPTFDGTDDYVEIDSSVVPGGSSVTLDIWVKDITVTATNAFYAGNSVDGRTLSVHLPWSDQVVYFDSGGATGSTIYDRITYTSTSTDRVGWHNWTFTKDLSAGVMRIYLDGAQKTSSAGKNISPDISTLARIGSALSTNYFSGEISQVKIYNRALTATEIKQNFESIRSRYNV